MPKATADEFAGLERESVSWEETVVAWTLTV
jgi:hypothetical protein